MGAGGWALAAMCIALMACAAHAPTAPSAPRAAHAPPGPRVPLRLVPQLGHVGPIEATVVGPDGEYAASASGDRTAKVWHIPTGALVRSIPHPGGVGKVAISRGGARVATLSGRELAVWDTSEGKSLFSFAAKDIAIGAIALSESGDRLVAATLRVDGAVPRDGES